MNAIYGGCYCGQIRYAITGPVETAVLCHCGNCRKAIGAQAVAWVILKKEACSILSGELTRYRTETGAWRGFCPKCGSSISYESPKRPEQIDLTTGSLDDPGLFPPTWDAYDDEKVGWVPLARPENAADKV